MAQAKNTTDYCIHCGTNTSPHWTVCRGCGGNLPAPADDSRPLSPALIASECCSPSEPARGWRMHPGRNLFLCNGFCAAGGDFTMATVTWGLNIIIIGLFIGFDIPYATERLSPAIPVALFFIVGFLFVSLASAGCTDPGIIPRGHHDEVVDERGETPAFVSIAVSLPYPNSIH